MTTEHIMVLRFQMTGIAHDDMEMGCYSAIKHLCELGLELDGNLFEADTRASKIWATAMNRYCEWVHSFNADRKSA